MSCPEWGGSLILTTWFEGGAPVGAYISRRLALSEWGAARRITTFNGHLGFVLVFASEN